MVTGSTSVVYVTVTTDGKAKNVMFQKTSVKSQTAMVMVAVLMENVIVLLGLKGHIVD
jgi:hypothetical protein